MIVTLFFAAAAMIAGGAWAVFTGWELIIIERGWTQVLLGGMLVTGGLLLAGIGVLAVHVKRLAGKLEQMSASKPSPLVAAAPAKRDEMPSRPPRQEPRSEPRPAPREEPSLQVEPEPFAARAEETGKPAAPAMSAPAAIALGAAAGAGTAAIASAILSSSSEARPPVEAEPAAEDETVEKVSSERLFADIEEPAAPTPGDEIMPTPDGEDSAMVLPPEGEEHVVPPVEETARLDDAPEETEREPSAEEEPYSAPTEERVEDVLPDLDEPPLQPETTPDIAEPLVDEERTVAGMPSDELAQDLPEVEGPLMEEEPSLEEFGAEERLPEPEPMQSEELEMAEPVAQDEGAPDKVAEPEPAPRSVVGNYESGGNVYTMYSDGSIDARTPSGDFHFASLDELKNFIAEGGEDPLT